MGTSILCIKYTLSVLSCCSDSRRARSSVAPAGQRHPQGGTCHPLRSPASKARTLGMPKGRRRDLESRWAERGMIWKGKTMELPLLLPYGCATSLHHPLLSQIPPFLCISVRRNSFSKMILPNPNHKQHFLLFLFLKEPFFLAFLPFFFFFGAKYSWQPLLCNRLLLPQPTATHFIPNSAFYFQASERWDEEFALKMCSEESGCHMCLEMFLHPQRGILAGAVGVTREQGFGRLWGKTRWKRVSWMVRGSRLVSKTQEIWEFIPARLLGVIPSPSVPRFPQCRALLRKFHVGK